MKYFVNGKEKERVEFYRYLSMACEVQELDYEQAKIDYEEAEKDLSETGKAVVMDRTFEIKERN